MRPHLLTSWAMAVLVVLLSLGSGLGQTEQPGEDIQSLVAAEHAFAQAAIEKGIREAFLTYLAEDALIFRPQAVPGKRWFEEHPAPAGILTWEPVFVEVSRAGDFGYTTGPWEFREKSLNDPPVQFGDYVTIWKKQRGGQWRAVLDIGTVHARPETRPSALSFAASRSGATEQAKPTVDVGAERAALLDQDRAFSRASFSQGEHVAFLSYATDEIRFYRRDAFPVIGKEPVRQTLLGRPGVLACQTTAADVSASGELGCTYGECGLWRIDLDDPLQRSSYVRIWRKHPDGGWKLALDIAIPIPPPAPTPGQ